MVAVTVGARKITRGPGGQIDVADQGAIERLEDRLTIDGGCERIGSPSPSTVGVAASLAPLLALAACSGDGTGQTGGPAPATSPSSSNISAVQASRFLAQTTFGATKATIAEVQSQGFDGWLTAQFGLARETTHWDWLVANGYNATANINNDTGFDPVMWRQMIVARDQLRQRVGIALLEILAIGIGGVQVNWRQFAMAAYVDVLMDNAFGNFRTILDKITTNAAMASFVTFLDNRKANSATGSVPDENYARELMQLYTIGPSQLNMDGTPRLSAGVPIETYTQDDVTGLARVFTGLTLANSDSSKPDRYRLPLVMNASTNETGASSFLGTGTSGGGFGAIKAALDTIFAHANMPPFISKQLIQRLVTSNPSPAYVSRVASAFADNGSGVRGDMKAVIRAILLDSEARADASLATMSTGKLREPVMRLTGWARAFRATFIGNTALGDTSSNSTRLAQSMGRSPTVFNFFRPGYAPPNTAIASGRLVAPEFQITNELSVVAYINFMQGLISNGASDLKADYADVLALANDSAALLDDINLVLAAGQLASATLAAIKAAIDSISASATNGSINRVYTAILLTMASPDYLILK